MGGGRIGGRHRLPLAAVLALLCWLASAPPALAATFDVNVADDVPDPNLGDGLCDVNPGAPGSQCTLRAAVQQANALPSSAQAPHVITLPAQTFTLTIPGRDELAGATGDLNVSAGAVRIVGQGPTQTTVQAGLAVGNGVDRVLRVSAGATATVESLTIRHGATGTTGAARSGGGVLNEGTATLVGVEVRDNVANNDPSQPGGGGVANGPNAALTMIFATVADNRAANNGGGIANAGSFLLAAITLAQNETGIVGGALFHASPLAGQVLSVTIAENRSTVDDGRAIVTTPGASVISIANSILENVNIGNCVEGTPLASGGGNVSSDSFCSFSPPSGASPDRTNTSARVGNLGLNGGQTRTMALPPNSPARNASTFVSGDPACGTPTTDQRGLARPQPLDPVQACDAGAVEVPVFEVRGEIDAVVPAPSAACRNGTNQCTLRQAVVDGNAFGSAIITLRPGTLTLTRPLRDEDAGLSGDLDVTAPLDITGAGMSATTIQAGTNATNGVDRIFHVRPGARLDLRDVTLRFGRAQGSGPVLLAGAGGAILSEESLTLERVVVRDNTAATIGGGISAGGRFVDVRDSEIRDNTASSNGGGLASDVSTLIFFSTVAGNVATNGAGGGLHITLGVEGSIGASTISGNRAREAAAIDFVRQRGNARLSQVSVVDNNNTTAGSGAVRYSSGGTEGELTVFLTLFAHNSSPNCQVADPVNVGSGSNLSDDTTCNVGSNTRLNTDPIVGQLRNNGGLTRTHALLPGSPAIDGGSANTSCAGTDQRHEGPGFSFSDFVDGDDVPGVRCDVGAFEVQRIQVNNAIGDFSDATPGDNQCTPRCSPRAAIMEANAQGHAVVVLPVGTFTLSRQGIGEDAAAIGDLDVTTGLTLLGAAAGTSVIQAGTDSRNGIDRVFDVRPGARASMRRVTVRFGQSNADGGGILNTGHLDLEDVAISSSSTSGAGGGLATRSSSDTRLRRVLVSQNQATGRGGGVEAGGGTLTLDNVTLSANSSSSRPGGGGIHSRAATRLNNLSLVDNVANVEGAGVFVTAGTTSMANTLLRNDGQDCNVASGGLVSLGYNVSHDDSCANSFAADPNDGDVQNATIPLGPLADNGGQTSTHALLNATTNPAVDGGNPTAPLTGSNGRCAATDQRNLPRPVDANRDGRAICDAGAFEVQPNEGGAGGGGAGAFSVQATPQQARPGQPVVLSFGWTVPVPQVWRSLDRLDLRLIASNGQPVFILRWTEAGDRYILLDASGRELAAGTPGSAVLLTTPFVSLALRDVKTQGSGPTGQGVTLTLPLVFSPAADDQAFAVQVAGRADSGAEDPFATAAVIQVGDPVGPAPPPAPAPHPNDDGKDEKPEQPRKETEEERQRRERGNAAGQDEYRTEGNVVEAHLDERPPYVMIATRDGPVRLNLRGDAARVTVTVGDYVTAEGEKVTEQLYEVDDLDVE